ncbi:MAG: hypothetical protein FJ147_16250 [Deltaproteobacteria bacterium]|nr:hypothetical protein [Deltaproteobacteria bacterium]
MVIWTDYFKYRARLRGFDLTIIEQIVRFSEERYFDTATQRSVAIGRHGNHTILVPYDQEDDTLTPVTVHVTTRQQVDFRLRTGRFRP